MLFNRSQVPEAGPAKFNNLLRSSRFQKSRLPRGGVFHRIELCVRPEDFSAERGRYTGKNDIIRRITT